MSLRRIFRPRREEKAKRVEIKTRPRGGVRLTARAVRQLDRLQLRGSKELRGEALGQRPSFRRMPASDFREHRMYVPGDDVRFVDWRASARHEQVFVKQGELPKEVTVYLLLDCSGSMAWGQPPKKHAHLNLAAALAYLALAHGDRLMIYPFGGVRNQVLGPISGKGQMPGVLAYLQSLRYGGESDLTKTVRRFSQRAVRSGLAFILSDLLGTSELDSALNYLPAPLWRVSILHMLHPLELNPALQGDMEMLDIETGETANYQVSAEALRKYARRLEDWRARLDMDCVEAKAFYTLMPSDMRLEREMIAHLRAVKVVAPL